MGRRHRSAYSTAAKKAVQLERVFIQRIDAVYPPKAGVRILGKAGCSLISILFLVRVSSV